MRVGDRVVEARRLVLPRAARRARRRRCRPDRLLLEPHGPLVRGGRGGLRPPARSLPPRRRPRQRPARAGLARRRACWRRRSRALALFESNLPARWYIPREDVARRRSRPATRSPAARTRARRATTRSPARSGKDLVWYYREPLPEAAPDRRACVCFFNERVDIELDGELQARPESPWSHGVKSEAPNEPPAVTRG